MKRTKRKPAAEASVENGDPSLPLFDHNSVTLEISAILRGRCRIVPETNLSVYPFFKRQIYFFSSL